MLGIAALCCAVKSPAIFQLLLDKGVKIKCHALESLIVTAEVLSSGQVMLVQLFFSTKASTLISPAVTICMRQPYSSMQQRRTRHAQLPDQV